MKLFSLLQLLLFFTAPAFAQTTQAAQSHSERSAQQVQRRAELRSALLEQRQATVAADQQRHFSEQERSALRQQLRRQQGASGRHP